jgi:hypothetical protein
MGNCIPDESTQKSLIALGNCLDRVQFKEHFRILGSNPYLQNVDIRSPFEWLNAHPWADGFAIIKGLVRLEVARLTRADGSVSGISRAYHIMEIRDPIAAMEIAAWVVDHTRNHFLPFGSMVTHANFCRVKSRATSWKQCREELSRAQSEFRDRQIRVAIEVANQKPEGQHRRKIWQAVAARINSGQTTIQRARSLARRQLLSVLSALSAKEQLEHIAWDDSHPLCFYTHDLCDFTPHDVQQLDPVTRERLMAKLKDRKSGPWQKLAKRLAEDGIAQTKVCK